MPAFTALCCLLTNHHVGRGGGRKEERLRGGDTLDKHVIEGKECAAAWWLGNTDASQCLLQGLNR